MPSRWIDVSVPLKTGMVHWPGDPALRMTQPKSLDRGDSCTLSFVEMGVHSGTHMDAPAHFVRGGQTMDDLPLDAVIGPARVIEIRSKVWIEPKELAAHRIRRGERILFRTTNSRRCWKDDAFVTDFVSISPAGAEWLAGRGVRTVGVDYLSVGAFGGGGGGGASETNPGLVFGGRGAKTNPGLVSRGVARAVPPVTKKSGRETHLALLGAGIWVIEGLNLSRVRAGRFDMVCLPLRLRGAEGSPARVALRGR
jgi:arylformamidase